MPITIVVPRLGWTMEQGTFGAWLKGDGDRVEVGDLLFTVVALARRLKINPEDALRVAGQRFHDRFAKTEASLREEGKSFRDMDAEQLALRWEKSG